MKGFLGTAVFGATTIGLTGQKRGELAKMIDRVLKLPSDDVQRIQECLILVGHITCELVLAEIKLEAAKQRDPPLPHTSYPYKLRTVRICNYN